MFINLLMSNKGVDKFLHIKLDELFIDEILLTNVVLPAPDGEDRITIIPSVFKGINLISINLVCLTFYKFYSIAYS